LDYLACGKLNVDVAAEMVKGVAAGCVEAGCVLLSGETAEMPGFYDAGKYDIAGFSVGIVDRKKIVDGANICEGDVLVGIASSGPHSNGFSLIRNVIPDLSEDFGGLPIGMALLEPTRLYVKPILSLLEKIEVHGMAHITGGGFYENVPRMFKEDGYLSAAIRKGSWNIPPIFARIAAGCYNPDCSGQVAQKIGAELLATNDIVQQQMFNTFNMGIGFVLAVAPADVHKAITHLNDMNFSAWEIGCVEKRGEKGALNIEKKKHHGAGFRRRYESSGSFGCRKKRHAWPWHHCLGCFRPTRCLCA
jgi:phosphoribosylformylglycinamidine cyclo-ligase